MRVTLQYALQDSLLITLHSEVDWVAGLEQPSVVELFWFHPCYCVRDCRWIRLPEPKVITHQYSGEGVGRVDWIVIIG